MGHLHEGHFADPFVLARPAGDGHPSIALGADRRASGGPVADIAFHIRVGAGAPRARAPPRAPRGERRGGGGGAARLALFFGGGGGGPPPPAPARRMPS